MLSPDERLAPWVSMSTRPLVDHPFMRLVEPQVEDTLVLPTGVEARWLRYADHREGVEEIGAFLLNPRKSGVRLRVFVATELEPRPAAPDETELIEAEWLEAADIDDAIASGRFDNTTLLSTWAIYRASRK